MGKKVSIVIPTFLGEEYLKHNLPEVLKLRADEIIVVNDSSPDSTSQLLTSKFPSVKVITNLSNLGFPNSVNKGIESSIGDYVLLLNQDLIPDVRLLTLAIPHFDRTPNLFAVTFNDNENSWASAKFESGFIEYGNGKTKKEHSSFWASGGASLINKSVWNKLGGFDTVFTPGYFEDQDIGYRAHKYGFEIIWDPECKITHAHPGSTFSKKFKPTDLTRLKERNYLIMHWKNLDPINLFTHILYLLKRIILNPGYIIPTLLAFAKLPVIMTNRMNNDFHLSDNQVFEKVINI